MILDELCGSHPAVQPDGIPHQSPPAHLSQPPGCSFLPWDCQWLLFLLAFQDLKIPAAGEMVKSWLLHDACPTLFVVRF